MSVNTALLAYERAREQSRKAYTIWWDKDASPQETEARRDRMAFASSNWRASFKDSDWPVYAVEPHITDLCLDAMASVDGDIMGAPEFMPTLQGFMYFMEPFACDMPDHTEELRYLAWQQGTTRSWLGDNPGAATLFAVGLWCPVDKLAMVRNYLPWRHGSPLRSIHPTDSVAPYAAGVTRIIAAIGLFMQQKVAVHHIAHASRNIYKQTLRRTGKEPPELRVVKLRTTESKVYQKQATHGREWSMRWVVRGHWRKQWFPKQRTHKPVWIAPYIKGPEGKPVVGGRKVFEVAR